MEYFKNICYCSKFIILLVLFFTFLLAFGKPAYMDFNRFKVMVDETTVEPQPLLTPAMTVCIDPVNIYHKKIMIIIWNIFIDNTVNFRDLRKNILIQMIGKISMEIGWNSSPPPVEESTLSSTILLISTDVSLKYHTVRKKWF